MFRNLVESGSHTADFRRRGSFFVGAVAFYAVLLAAAGVGSIYAYNVRLDDREELEVLALMHFPPQPATAEPVRREAPRPAAGAADSPRIAQVTEVVKITPYANEVARTNAPVLPDNVPYVVSNVNSIPPGLGGPPGPRVPGVPGGNNTTGPVVDSGGEVAPPAKIEPPKVEPPKPEPPRVVRLASTIISSKAISKPTPAYPALAITMRVQGTVPVQILIDEQGRVVQAQATGGHPLLQKAAADAARRATFSPTILSERPVKASGIIYYNFVIQ